MHHFICQFCHTDCMLKLTQGQLARVRKKKHFSQYLPRGELWTVLRLALAHTVTEICTTSFVNLSYWLYAEGAKINAKSTYACAKETTFFTISTSWWTLNCSPLSSISHGYWDMHHFICQFCHTDCMLKVLKLTQSQLACVQKNQHFSQSLPRGKLWTVLRLALAHKVLRYAPLHCQFCHTDCMLKVLKLTQSQLARVRKKQYFSQSLPCGELWTILRLALAHTGTEICTTSFVNFVILIVMLKLTQSQLARVRKKQHFSQSLPRGELWTVLRLALAHTVTEICTTSFVNFFILIIMLKLTQSQLARVRKKQHFSQSLPRGEHWTVLRLALAYTVTEICITSFVNFVILLKLTQSQLGRVRKKQHFSQSLPRGELWTVLRLALAHTVTEICTTSFVNFVILIVC